MEKLLSHYPLGERPPPRLSRGFAAAAVGASAPDSKALTTFGQNFCNKKEPRE